MPWIQTYDPLGSVGFVFWHSLALAAIMGLIVMAQAYVFPWMIPAG